MQGEYNDEISNEDLNKLLSQAHDDSNLKNGQLASMFNNPGKKDANFLHLQISTQEMLERLEHFYKGDILQTKNGNISWTEQKNKDLVTFNEYGVTSLMEIITKYIDRNTILSNYSEERIYEIMADLGDDLTLFILCNYVKLGMDTYFKKTKFRIVISSTLHIIESTYRRALRGKTIEELNQSRISGEFGNPIQNKPQQPARNEGWLKRQFT
jgi:hypothetical protein